MGTNFYVTQSIGKKRTCSLKTYEQVINVVSHIEVFWFLQVINNW